MAHFTPEYFTEYRREMYEWGSAADRGGKPMARFYDIWADRYAKLHDDLGFPAPSNMAAIASEIIGDKSVRILDAASGIGMVGEALKNLGFTCIDALDASQISLDKSKERQCYTEYICDTLDDHRTKIPDNNYDAVVMCGAFGVPGHVDDLCFPELIRITKPGGYIMFTLSVKVFDQWEARLEAVIGALSEQGQLELVEYRWIQYYSSDKLNEKAKVPILRVLSK